jgi:predicted enzyme related to lactoylglutathione lyase
MSQRDSYPAGVPCWVEMLAPDSRATGAFYGDLMGWTLDGPGPMPDGGEYFVAQVDGRDVAGIGTLPVDAPTQWTTYVSVDDPADTVSRVRAAGGTVIAGPVAVPPAGELALIADPQGAVLGLWKAGSRRGAQLINQAGAWAMSALHTPDPAGAEEFYGRVFGWTRETMDGFGLCRLPGYVGGEPQQPVPRDVVAVMLAADGTPHWSVDFWVSDTDATAARATELGGRVHGPFDVPGFRQAVVADPEGAAFTISQLQI